MGQVISSPPEVVVDTTHAWGYLSPQEFRKWGADSLFRTYVYVHNGLNVGSIFLSPLAGIIRIITSVFLLAKIGNVDQSQVKIDIDAARCFLRMQAGRGVMEFFCLGPILGTVVDGLMTCKHKELFCFGES